MVRRRTLLRTGVAVGLGGVAGCTFGLEGGPGESTPESTPATGPVTGFNFDGPHLVVGLREGHAVEELNLVSPDGSLFTGAAVETGVTTVRVPLLEIRPVDWTHYTPGVNRLVAVAGDETWTMALELRPDLRIVEVRQYREGTGADFGRVAVEVENVGTGPTWVYQITYEDAPNRTANAALQSDKGVVFFKLPETPGRLIVGPNSTNTLVGGSTPISLRHEPQSCNIRDKEFDIIVAPAAGGPLRKRLRAEFGGDVVPFGMVGEYACNRVEITLQ